PIARHGVIIDGFHLLTRVHKNQTSRAMTSRGLHFYGDYFGLFTPPSEVCDRWLGLQIFAVDIGLPALKAYEGSTILEVRHVRCFKRDVLSVGRQGEDGERLIPCIVLLVVSFRQPSDSAHVPVTVHVPLRLIVVQTAGAIGFVVGGVAIFYFVTGAI